MTPGLYTDIPESVYHADPCDRPSLSASMAHILVDDCPARAFHSHPRLGGNRRDPTDEMERGTLIHALLLGTGKEVRVFKFKDWRTNEAKAAKAQAKADGAIPILAHRKLELDYVVMGIQQRLDDLHISFEVGSREAVMHWIEEADDGTKVLCRGMTDHILLKSDKVLITDLKTCESAKPTDCAKSCINYGYDIQWAAYTSAARKLWPDAAGREHMRFIFMECEPPYIVTPAVFDGTMRELGERKWRRAVNLWAECMRTGDWPGYTKLEARLSAPAWAVEES